VHNCGKLTARLGAHGAEGVSACSACAGDYEDPDATAPPVDDEDARESERSPEGDSARQLREPD
jgi:hypothetical protein